VAAAAPVSRLESVLRRLARDLEDLGARWALVGALAVSVRTEPRFTRDVDLAVATAGDPEAERLARDLQARGYRVQALVEHERTGRLATIRVVPPGEDPSGLVADLLFASSGIEPELVAAAESLDALPGLSVPVARLGHLVALKLLARDDLTRPQDRVDLVALLRAARPGDLAEARQAARLIAERGFARGRDLAGALDALLQELRQ
jgi:hypothetical protein